MRARSWFPMLFVALVAACGGSTPSTPGATGSEPTGGAPVTTAPALTAPATAATTPAATTASATAPTATLEPGASLAAIRIDEVECLTGLTVRMHIHATVATTIDSYQVWSTWGGGNPVFEVFSAPLPSQIDKVIEFTHQIVDPQAGRIHEFGLSVKVTGVADQVIVYALEPHFRCPGH